MIDGVLYIFGGELHSILAAVSIQSLRQHWSGQVAACCWDDPSFDLASSLGLDHVERIESRHVDPKPLKSGLVKPRWVSRAYGTNKARARGLSPFHRTIFLDTDTVIVGDITDVFPTKMDGTVTLTTSHSSWPPEHMIAYERAEVGRRERELNCRRHAATTSIAVFGFSVNSNAFFHEWWSRVQGTCHSSDLVVRSFYMKHKYRIVDYRYQMTPDSPPWQRQDARIWHFPGVNRFKSDEAHRIWWPRLAEAVESNVGGIADLVGNQIGSFRREWRKWRRANSQRG